MTYALPKTRTNCGIFNIRYQGANIWNDNSDDIKPLPLKHFKKKIKSNIIAAMFPFLIKLIFVHLISNF